MQQLIPRDKKETESRFRLQHKILTADDAVVCFVKCYKISERNTLVQKKMTAVVCICLFRQLLRDIIKK